MMSLIKDQKGSVIVEMAGFVLTCAMIVFGFISITGTIKDNLGMHAAAREAARNLSIWQDINEAKEVAVNELAAAGIENYDEIDARISGNNAIVCIKVPHKIPFLPNKIFDTEAKYSFFLEVDPDIYLQRGYYD